MDNRILVTGGCGFIGSHLVDLLLERGYDVVVLDALSFGSDIRNLPEDVVIVGGISGQMITEVPRGRCVLVVGDVSDARLVRKLVDASAGVFHLAAQSHVDRSYGDVLPFVNANVVGAYAVLEALRSAKYRIRCVFVSTDEVYGDVEAGLSKETDALAPRNIYSTLKAGGDLLAQTYAAIFNLDVVIARPANNYGPRQFEEKLIPKIVTALQAGKKIPVYGDGKQLRDWLYVKDTVLALAELFKEGKAGGIYNLGAHQWRTVLDVVQSVGDILGVPWQDRIEQVPDRIRGDRRYALDVSKVATEIGWSSVTPFEAGLRETLSWYGREYVDGKRR